MLARYLVFAEEVFNDVFATLGIIEGTIPLEKGTDALRGQVSVGDLLFRQLVDALHNGLITHIQHDQLSWC
jgi:hypothetical protein